MNYTFFLIRICLLFTCLLSAIPNYAQLQDSESITMESDSLQVKPKAIPLINIVQEMDNTTSDLKLIQRKINRGSEIAKIDSLLPVYAKFLKAEGDRVEHFIKANPNLQKINNLNIKWNGYLNYLEQWMSTINKQEQRNDILVKGIVNKDEIWKLSYDNASKQAAPESVLEAIKKTMDRVNETKSKIFSNNYYYINLETKINTQINYVQDVLEDLNTLKNSEVYDLFYLRHPPIWKTSFKKTPIDETQNQEIESIHGNVSGIYRLAKNDKGKIIIFALFVGLFTLIVRYFKRGFEKYPFEDNDEVIIIAKNLIINRHTLCIIFLSLLLAKFYFTSIPKLLSDSTTLLLIIVSIPIIKPLMTERFKNILYFVVLFYILNSAKTYFWFSSLGYRLYLLIESVIVIIILYHFTNPYLKTRALFKSGFNWLLIRLVPFIYFLSVVSIISNILGYTNLTDISLKVSTQSSIITTLFYSLALILNGIVISIIHRHFTVKKTYSAFERKHIENRALKTIRITVYVLWSISFLGMIDVLRPLTEYLRDAFSEPYQIGSLTFTLGAVVSFILTLIISFCLTRLVSFLINDDDGVLRFLKLPKGVPAAVSVVIRYFIIGFGIILALSALGVDLSKFNLMAGALGLGIGFGLQTVVSNFISGLILVFERPILPGDTVEVNNLLGTVNRIGVRSSSISTFDGAEVVVPNNNLISNDLINWTLSNNTKRVEILIGTTYDSDPNKILNILEEVANAHQYTLKDPEPRALFNDFGDSSLNFRLLFWVYYEFGLQAKSDVSIAIYNKFKEEGIEIPFPQRDLNIRNFPENYDFNQTPPLPLVNKTDTTLDKNMEQPIKEPLDTNVDSGDASPDDDPVTP